MKGFSKGKVNLYQGDNMEFMASKPDNYYDLAVVDPEYGINAGRKKQYHSGALTAYRSKTWDNKPAGEMYFNELLRVSKHQIIWGFNYVNSILPNCKKPIVWDKMQPEGIDQAMFELAYNSNSKIQAKIYRQSAQSNSNKVANNKHKASKYIRIHPTQKPVKLYDWIFHNYAKPDFKILDTHGGSMSSAIAAYYFGCEFDCIELDKDYYNDAVKRFKEMTLQTKLF